jgi:hypothetical protein
MHRATVSRKPSEQTTTKFSARKLLTETKETINPQTQMVKMKTTKEDYETALAQAALLFSGWMSRFEAPVCHEQQVVVEATMEWLENTKHLIDENV